MSTNCHACGVGLAPAARYCGSCGAAARHHARAVQAAAADERRRDRRAAIALGAVCTAPLLAMAGSANWLGEGEDAAWGEVALQAGILLLANLAAVAGLGTVRAAWPLRTHLRWCAAALPVAALTLGAAVGWVALLPGPPADEIDAVTLPTWLAVVAVAPLGEELLCRGIAWRAAAVLASPRLTLVLTAVLFAFLHGMNGGWLLELPHRFAGGLAYGWLRGRSGSVLPGMLAHGLHNTVAIACFGG